MTAPDVERFELKLHGHRTMRALAHSVRQAGGAKLGELGVLPQDRPLFRGPVGFSASFRLADPARPPSLTYLMQVVWDGLYGCGVMKSGYAVVEIDWLDKVAADTPEDVGVDIVVRRVNGGKE